MRLRQLLPLALLTALVIPALAQPATTPSDLPANPAPPDGKPHTFAVAGSQFQLDGKPVRIISGEMHYPRIPREYWRARLKMARAMGLNAITTYVFWNVHEPTPGTYDFSGQNDVAEFIREAQQEGLYVILRPGPYVCAEWEFGGYPAWLLKDPTTVVRSQDPKFMEPATRWIKRLGQELAPLQIGKGGPIVLVQVENEYGSFGNDHVYMDLNRKALLDAGFTKAQFYTADGPGDIANGSLPDLPVGINFDGNKPNQAEKSFATLKAKRPDGPMFNSEFWAGWFDHWGGPHAHTSTETQAANLAWMLAQGYSVSIYMFHGGTDFGWMNGANSSDSKKDYQPDVTSYDYDSALDESGRPTSKFFAFRDIIAKATGVALPAVPEVAPPIHIAPIHLTESAVLWRNLPDRVRTDKLLTMEDLDQSFGYILYRTFSTQAGDLDLVLDGLHDYARIYVNEQFVGTLDRRLDQNRLSVHIPKALSRLDILVENTGRINYSHQIRSEREGVTKQVTLGGRPITEWQIYSLPMADPTREHFQLDAPCSAPCFFQGSFDLPGGTAPADTFLDTSKLGKGQLWVNGHALGRFWKIGPQKTLYLPGPWLKPGKNEIIIFDLDGNSLNTIEGLTKPDLGPPGTP